MIDLLKIRNDFPVLAHPVNGKQLVYLDNAATTLKPKQVVDRISHYYLYESSNVHRGLHFLSDQATLNFENARKTIQKFIGASTDEEVLFNKGTTDSINFIAQTYGWQYLKAGDEVLVSEVEHHSNIVPWQILAERKNIVLKTFEVGESSEATLSYLQNALTDKTKIVSTTHISNTLGITLPVAQMAQLAHQAGAILVVDGAQAVAHHQVNVQELNCDFYAFSAHKIYGPTGFGVLYGKKEILKNLNPYQGGGGIIDQVTFKKTTYIDAPFRFEPGTPHIEGAIGLEAAIQYVESIGLGAIAEHEGNVAQVLQKQLSEIPGVKIYGSQESAIVSFVAEGLHPTDIGSLLDHYGVAVRAGHHCTQPLMKKLNVPGTVRASLAIYNTEEEVQFFIDSLQKVLKILRG